MISYYHNYRTYQVEFHKGLTTTVVMNIVVMFKLNTVEPPVVGCLGSIGWIQHITSYFINFTGLILISISVVLDVLPL